MKKTVIKRRKRVPAAGPTVPGSPTQQDRMTDQAAAEVLASVRGHSGNSVGAGAVEESEEDQPRRKRARKPRVKAGEKGEGGMDVDDEDGEEDEQGRAKRARRQTGPRAPQRRNSAAGGNWPVEAGPSASPSELARNPRTQELDRYGAGAPRGSPFGANPHGGFDLPPLTAALGNGDMQVPVPASMSLMMSSQGPHYSGPAMGIAGAGYVLPPPHGLAHGHHSMSGHHPSFYQPSNAPVPTLTELERHYFELQEQRRKFQEMMERTEYMLAGVKRGMDEMRNAAAVVSAVAAASQVQVQTSQGSVQAPPAPSQPQPPSGQPQQQAQANGQGSQSQHQPQQQAQGAAVPIGRTSSGGSKESIWPVAPPESAKSAKRD